MIIENLARKIMEKVLVFGFCPPAKISPWMAEQMAFKCQKLADSVDDLSVEIKGGSLPFVTIKNEKTGKGIWINPVSTSMAYFEEIRMSWLNNWGSFEDETLEKGEINFE